MKTKSKVIMSISIILILLSVAITTIAIVWALSQQKFKSQINVNYVAEQVKGTATAQWKVGNSDSWHSMTTSGKESGSTVVTFGAQVKENATLIPTKDYIDLSGDNPFIVFKYSFTNTGNNAFAIDLFYEDDDSADTNMSVFVLDSDKDITSNYTSTIKTAYGNWSTTSVEPGNVQNVYILASITDITNNASYSGSFSFTLDGKNHADYVSIDSTGTITGLTKDVSVLRIPSEINGTAVKTIKTGAFANKTSLTEVTIPDSVTTIQQGAFNNGCTNLKYISIPFVGNTKTASNQPQTLFGYIFGASVFTSPSLPNKLTNVIVTGGSKIDIYAFGYCSVLTSITVPNSVTSMGNYAFYGCSGLKSIIIPSSVETIGNSAFCNCSGLTGNITIPEGVTSIESSTFYNCSGLTSIIIPNSVESVGDYAFEGCNSLECNTNGQDNNVYYLGNNENPYLILVKADPSISNCTIPSSTKFICSKAFYKSSLNAIEIPSDSKLISIGEQAFYECPIRKITIPQNVTSIGSSAFYNCIGLTLVKIESGTIYANANSTLACGYLLQYATTIDVLTSCMSGKSNSYLNDSTKFSSSVGGDHTHYTSKTPVGGGGTGGTGGGSGGTGPEVP